MEPLSREERTASQALAGGTGRRTTPSSSVLRRASAKKLPRELRVTIDAARHQMFQMATDEGFWAGVIRGDVSAAASYLFMAQLLERSDVPQQSSIAAQIRDSQLSDGGWSLCPSHAMDLSLSVRCYLALKLVGDGADEPHMIRAREAILMRGGADRTNGATRILLARFGQVPYQKCPAIPPEILLLPPRAPLSLFRVPLPSRIMLVALSLVWSTRRIHELPTGKRIGELFFEQPPSWQPCEVGQPRAKAKWPPTAWIVRSSERCVSWLEHHRCHVLRPGALLLASRWLCDRVIHEDESLASMSVAFWSAVGLASLPGERRQDEIDACIRSADRLVACTDSNDSPPMPAIIPLADHLALHAGPSLAPNRPASERLPDAPADPGQDGGSESVAPDNALIGTAGESPTTTVGHDATPSYHAGGDGEKPAFTVQPWQTAVTDTARALRGLALEGFGLQDVRMQNAVDWLLRYEITKPLDPPRSHRIDIGGWCLLQPRSKYPDVESTAEVLLALRSLFSTQPDQPSPSEDSLVAMVHANSTDLARRQVALLDRVAAASRRGRRWLLAMQNTDGGWGRFERFGRRSWLEYSAWSDSFATRDPSSPEVSGSVLEALGRWEFRCGRAAIDRSVEFLRRSQRGDGTWHGEWTVNPIYATWRVLEGLRAVGLPSTDLTVAAAVNWMLDQQHADGSWGQTPLADNAGNESPLRHRMSSAVQTAWSVMALIAAGSCDHQAVRLGVDYLLEHQLDTGTWTSNTDLLSRALGTACCKSDFNAVYYPYAALVRWSQTKTAVESLS